MEQNNQQQPQPMETVRILSTIEQSLIQGQAVEAIKTCYDPEIPVNIYEMGLVYDVKVAADGGVLVIMTLTSPHCPAAQSLPKEVEMKVRGVPGVTDVAVKVVWDPVWTPGMMSEAAKLELGM
jgi:FeS assembly SUF system protein